MPFSTPKQSKKNPNNLLDIPSQFPYHKQQQRNNMKRNCSNPYRPLSTYHTIYEILKAHRNGITRQELIKLTAKKTGKDLKKAGYLVQVVVSPDADGRAHKSADLAADFYWVEKMDGGCLRLHGRG